MQLNLLIGAAVALAVGTLFIVFRVRIAESFRRLLRISYGSLFPDKPLPALFVAMGVGWLIIGAILLLRGVGLWD